jgi:hypothetical protein
VIVVVVVLGLPGGETIEGDDEDEHEKESEAPGA